MTTVRGVDLSNNNTRQNWSKLRSEGVRFAFFKASEGEHSRDGRFSVHLSDAKAAKITTLGAYHFAWPNESAAANASNYIAAVKAHAGPGFVHWLDLEPYSDGRNYRGRNTAQIRQWAEEWLQQVHRAFPGQRVGIYAGAGENARVPANWPRWFPAYPWSESGTYAKAEAHPRPTNALFWQFVGSPLDRSLFYGSEADLLKWAGGAAGTTSPAPAPKPKPKPGRPRVVTVKAGQTLGAIALILGVSWPVLAHYNHISNPNLIYPGQHISAPPAAPPRMSPHPPAVKVTPKSKPPTTRPVPTVKPVPTTCNR